MEENNYSVVDVSSDDNKNILAVGDHFQVYFYKFKNEKLANKSIKKSIKELNSEDNKIVKEEKDNYLKYEISNNNIYTIYYMVDNTYIYISTTSNYKKDAVDLIKLLGY